MILTPVVRNRYATTQMGPSMQTVSPRSLLAAGRDEWKPLASSSGNLILILILFLIRSSARAAGHRERPSMGVAFEMRIALEVPRGGADGSFPRCQRRCATRIGHSATSGEPARRLAALTDAAIVTDGPACPRLPACLKHLKHVTHLRRAAGCSRVVSTRFGKTPAMLTPMSGL